MKNKFILFLILLKLVGFANNRQDSLSIKIKNIEINAVTKIEFENQIKEINSDFNRNNAIQEKTLDSISKQIEGASFNVTIFSICFGIMAVLLGVYVTYIERKIVKISEDNKDLLTKSQKIKTEVEEVNSLIQKDIYGLYVKIKREETLNILERLIKIPKDITNVCSTLLSRELLEEDFNKLKQAFKNLKPLNNGDQGEEDSIMHYSEQYKLIFFQHFLGQSMRNTEIRNEMANYLYFAIQNAFENDIIKSTFEFTTSIIDLGIHNFKTEITKYFEGLSVSDFRDYDEVYKTFYNTLKTRTYRFEFYNLIENKETTRRAKINYGQLLKINYLNDNPTPSEKLVFEDLATLIKDEEIYLQKIKESLNKLSESNEANKSN